MGVSIALALLAGFFGLMLRSRTLVLAAEKRCDRNYRSALAAAADLKPVKECYLDVLRAKPWNTDVTFKIQSAGDLEAERLRTPAAEPGPLSRLARGDLAACDRIETDPQLSSQPLRSRWLQLCIMLTQ